MFFLLSRTRKCAYQNGRPNKTVSKRSVTSIQHGGQLEVSEDDPPVIIEEALQNIATVYRKSFNREERSNLNKLKMYLTGIKKTVVDKVLDESEAVKWYLSLRLHFHKTNKPITLTEPLVVFRTEVFTSVNVENIDAMFAAAYNELVVTN